MKDTNRFIKEIKKNEKEIWLHNFQDNILKIINITYAIKEQYPKYHIIIDEDVIIKKEDITFKDDQDEKGIEIELSDITFNKDIYVESSKEKKGTVSKGFSIISFKEIVNFSYCTFKGKIDFSDSTFEDNVDFSNCKFLGETNFSNVQFGKDKEDNIKINFSGSHFGIDGVKNDIDFSNAKFNGNTRFHHCIFNNNTSFENTEFHKLVDFYDATFKEPQQFHLTDFLDRVIFSDATFKQEVQFLHCKVNSSSIINFHSTKFEKGLDISRSNFNICKMSFWDVKVDNDKLKNAINSVYYLVNFNTDWLFKIIKEQTSNIEAIKDNDIEEIISNEESTIYQKIDIILSKVKKDEEQKKEIRNKIISKINKLTPAPKKLRESMRFIKNSFYSEGNRIEGSEFEKKELEVYREELYIKMRGTEKKEIKSKNNSLFEDITAIFIMVLLLSAYIFHSYEKFYYLYFILFTGIYFYSTIKKSTLTIQNIKTTYKNNKLVTGAIYSLSIIVILSFFITLYFFPEDHNYFIWIIYWIMITITMLILSYLSKDYIILLFNKHSNDFGTNWVNGVVFTLLVSITTFGIMALLSDLTLVWHERGINNVLEGILEIINLFPFKETNKDSLFYNMNTGTKVVLFIGRIFIAYGVYQTIQAFRKYGKS